MGGWSVRTVCSNLKNTSSNSSPLSTDGSQTPLLPALLPSYPTLTWTPVPHLPLSPASRSTGQAPLDLDSLGPRCVPSETSHTVHQNQRLPHKRPSMAPGQLRGGLGKPSGKAHAGSATNTALPSIKTAEEDPELKKARARLGCAQGSSFPRAELARAQGMGLNNHSNYSLQRP